MSPAIPLDELVKCIKDGGRNALEYGRSHLNAASQLPTSAARRAVQSSMRPRLVRRSIRNGLMQKWHDCMAGCAARMLWPVFFCAFDLSDRADQNPTAVT
jgi:hypothetical protein